MGLFGPRQKPKQRATPEEVDQDRFSKVASQYIKQKGYTDSSLEAVRRSAKANRKRSRVNIGNYPQDI